MKDLSNMSPVAKATYFERQNKVLADMLGKSIQKNHALRREVTGALQIIWTLAKREGGTLTLSAVDLITASGAVQRQHNAEADTYTFTALDPTPEQIENLETELEREPAAPALDLVPTSEQPS